MIGAILGDIVGSRFEFTTLRLNKSEDFELLNKDCFFTDDTIMTIATADSVINNKDLTKTYQYWCRKYPDLTYGDMFKDWINSNNPKPYNSFGNGSAMRVSSIGWLYNDLETVMQKAEETANITHNHIEGQKGAVSVATCIYLARNKVSKKIIKEIIETYFDYNLSRTIEEIRPDYQFDETCQGSVPESIICFLEGNSYEDVIRKTISLGGDTDTQACIAGGIAEAYYRVPIELKLIAYDYLPKNIIKIINDFYKIIKENNNGKIRI